MTELLDKLVLRLIFAICVCLVLWIYKQTYLALPKFSKGPLSLSPTTPPRNSAELMHILSRVIGLTVVFSGLSLDFKYGIWYGLLELTLKTLIVSLIQFISLYLMESIALFNLDYQEEILRKKNDCLGFMIFVQSLCVATLLRNLISNRPFNLMFILFFWPFSLLLLGLGMKGFRFLSKQSLTNLIARKNYAIILSYIGHLSGFTFILSVALDHPFHSLERYILEIVLNLTLAVIIFPIFLKILKKIFSPMTEEIQTGIKNTSIFSDQQDLKNFSIGQGLYEGGIFFTAYLLTGLINNQVNFDSLYPAL